MSLRLRVVILMCFGVFFHFPAAAQYRQQTIRMVPGWNAVFFEVQPAPRDTSSVFQGVPVESVWAWNRRFTSVQFVQDPSTLLPDQPEWLTFYPPGSPQAFLTNLHIIQGGRSYLVKLGGTQPVDLVVTGRPKIRTIDWMSDSFNLVGFHVDGASPPTFEDFFSHSAAHAGQQMYRLSPTGQWQVLQAATESVQEGNSYWIYCKGQSKYQGPVSVVFDVRDGLDYERILIEQTLTVTNGSAASRTITLTQKPSVDPPDPSLPLLAGEVPLSHFEFDVAGASVGYVPLTGPISLTVPPSGVLEVDLAVRRSDMDPFDPPPPADPEDGLYQSLLELSDGSGSLLVLPVSAENLVAPRVASSAAAASRQAQLIEGPPLESSHRHARTGLWVGTAVINAISNPTSGALNPTLPLPTASRFSFRLIAHVDETGQARLLQQVLQMWKDGAFIPNPDDPTSSTFILDPNNPGRNVLLTDDSLIPQFKGIALRDVDLVGRRVSSAAFSFREPIDMGGGDFGNPASGPTTVTVGIDYRDPLNPFVHGFHPDHDNWDARYENVRSEGKESFNVTRDITLEFTATDPENLATPGWGDSQIGGIYREAIRGIHRSTVHVEGVFRLSLLTDVGVLNDGL